MHPVRHYKVMAVCSHNPHMSVYNTEQCLAPKLPGQKKNEVEEWSVMFSCKRQNE